MDRETRAGNPQVGRRRSCLKSIITASGLREATQLRCATPTSIRDRRRTNMSVEYTTAQIAELLEKVSNWGRWGKEDQRGALNFITKEKRVAAARLVQSGEAMSVALPLATRPARDNPVPVTHLMVRSGFPGHPLGSAGCADYFAIEPHGLATTHLDALCHHFWRDKMYNGFDAAEVDFQGAHKCAIDV